jgi:hypothetical protein
MFCLKLWILPQPKVGTSKRGRRGLQGKLFMFLQDAEKLSQCHCEERFLRRGNPDVIDIFKTEIASLRSQRQLMDFFSDLIDVIRVHPWRSGP